MPVKNFILAFLAAIVLTLAAASAFANGINPPRSTGSATITAVCKQADRKEIKLFRTRLYAGKSPVETISFRSADAEEEVRVTDIHSIAFTGAIDRQGYLESVVEVKGEGKKEGRLQARTNKGLLSLKGFKSDRSRVSIELHKCRNVQFSSTAAPQEEIDPPPALH